jgi:hypothetical protein
MGNFKDEIREFYKKEDSFRFSKNMWLDLLGHGLIGLTLGTIIILIRGTNPMPTLLLLPTVTTAWGLRNYLKKKKKSVDVESKF